MKRVIISGGGTGGHVFPAIAIANALKAKVKDIDILFIGAKGKLEMEKVPAAGYKIEGLDIMGFQRRLTWKNLIFPVKLVTSLMKARTIIAKFNPDLVIGVGGYASGPTLRVATFRRIPSLIQEQNSFPGVTNRILATRVQKICVAYEGMEKYFPAGKIVLTGNPIRQEMVMIAGKREEAQRFFGLEAGKKTLLIIGGSLGAGTINQAILKFVKEKPEVHDIQVLWQTGKYYFERINSQIKTDELRKTQAELRNVVILPFIDRMDLAYAAADLIVSRAGAIAISELCVIGKPVILVPSPNVAEDHQTKNARALSSRKAAILMPDAEAVENLGNTVMEVFGNQNLQTELITNITMLGIADAAGKIAEVALEMNASNDEFGMVQPSSVYLLGIGGIGMSALARYFVSRGANVSGYDKTSTGLTDQLVREGMHIHFIEDTSLVPAEPGLVIFTPAVPADHPELLYFKAQGIPMKKRAEVLGMISSGHPTIAVAGTHGKTTTSTMIAHMLRNAGVRSMAFLGGISKNYGTNFLDELQPGSVTQMRGEKTTDSTRDQNVSYCVVEADEYDKSFLRLTPYLAIITSADADHLDIYGSHEDLKKTFSEFTSKICDGGYLIMKAGTGIKPADTGRFKTYQYAVADAVDFHAVNIRVVDGLFHFDFVHPGGRMTGFISGVPGKFNLENSIAALSAGYLLGLNEQELRDAVSTYQGVQRRFEFRIRRPGMVYIDDYAHHPEELISSIGAARALYPDRKITGVFQPHLFSRTRDFADGFARSLELLDELILLEIYPAREKPIAGITSQMLLDRINIANKRLVQKDDLLQEIRNSRPEVLLTLGAGDIDQFVDPITELLSEETDR
jgi:UDP-N-acetylmuramate--alanine ligase